MGAPKGVDKLGTVIPAKRVLLSYFKEIASTPNRGIEADKKGTGIFCGIIFGRLGEFFELASVIPGALQHRR
ncbi:MAG: hypothetical protein RIA10_10265 [Amphiplicatus sp.]